MPMVPTAVLPKRIPHGPLKPSTAMQVSPLLLESAGTPSTLMAAFADILEVTW